MAASSSIADKVRLLIQDTTLRKQMGEAGRQETLKWNWRSATSVLRNLQYTRAERNFEKREREWHASYLRPRNWIRFVQGKPALPFQGLNYSLA